VNGGSHNTLIVATNDGLIAVEAPGDDGQSKIVMGLAEQEYPGKPWKYLLLDHHHIDHIGGLRAFGGDHRCRQGRRRQVERHRGRTHHRSLFAR
jgi:glyoxylase-like metal-dependent hydrolase (beta-lactamase superfamily II)